MSEKVTLNTQWQESDYEKDILVATMMSQTLNCCAERKYLDTLDSDNSLIELYNLNRDSRAYRNITWLKLTTVGKPVNDTTEVCFGYIQKILLSSAIPQTQLTFLVIGNGKNNEIFLGLRDVGSGDINVKSSVSALDNFAKVCWPGLKFEKCDENAESFKEYWKMHYDSIQSITGIPTLANKDQALGTVEHLIGGLRGENMHTLLLRIQ